MYKAYQHLLDSKLDNSTFLVLLVAFLIVLVGTYVPSHNELAMKNNILEIPNINSETGNIVEIDGKKYVLFLEEVN